LAEVLKVTEVKAQPFIEEIKGSCPKCGGELRFKEHVMAWNSDGSPSKADTYTEPYCDNCKLFWCAEEAD